MIFEELQILKFAWCDELVNWAALNREEVEEIDDTFVGFLAEDAKMKDWETEADNTWGFDV